MKFFYNLPPSVLSNCIIQHIIFMSNETKWTKLCHTKEDKIQMQFFPFELDKKQHILPSKPHITFHILKVHCTTGRQMIAVKGDWSQQINVTPYNTCT